MNLFISLIFILTSSNFSFAGGEENTLSSQTKKTQHESFDHSHSAWTTLLSKYVKLSDDKKSSAVDYKSFDKNSLNSYLKTVSSVSKKDFSSWTKNQQLAFYINTYNAYTVKLILNNYPVTSIKKIGSFFKNAWKQEFFKLFGEDYYLDKIEHKKVRESGKYKDARIHFAFNCASIGCPALLNEAWTAKKLKDQLDSAAKNFLSDQSRNKVDLKSRAVRVSNIFKWYGSDFEDNKMGYSSLKGFFKKYKRSLGKNKEEQELLESKSYSVKYTGYDWGLNKH